MDASEVVKETPFEVMGDREKPTRPSSEVQVVAPLDLPEGSTFVASIGEDGRSFTAVVVSGILYNDGFCILFIIKKKKEK